MLAAREFKRDGKEAHTYEIDFVDSAHHFQANPRSLSLDSPWAKRVSEYIGSKHHTIMVDTPDLIENLLIPMRMHDRPIPGQIGISLYLLFKAMRKDATVGLSGATADIVVLGTSDYEDKTYMNAGPTIPWLAATAMQSIRLKRHLFWLSPDVEHKVQLDEYVTRIYQASLAEVPHLEGEDPKAARRREIIYQIFTNGLLPGIIDRHQCNEHSSRFRDPYAILRSPLGGICVEYPQGR